MICTEQMIPSVRVLLSTSWDSKIREALAKEKAEAAKKAVMNSAQTAAKEIEGKTPLLAQ